MHLKRARGALQRYRRPSMVLVAEYRQLLGSGWYATYDVPSQAEHEAAVCTAVKRKKPPMGGPCFYIMLERYETRGGQRPPLD